MASIHTYQTHKRFNTRNTFLHSLTLSLYSETQIDGRSKQLSTRAILSSILFSTYEIFIKVFGSLLRGRREALRAIHTGTKWATSKTSTNHKAWVGAKRSVHNNEDLLGSDLWMSCASRGCQTLVSAWDKVKGHSHHIYACSQVFFWHAHLQCLHLNSQQHKVLPLRP